MFKNVMMYRIDAAWAAEVDAVEEALRAMAFVPCGATQPKAMGWVPPRGHAHGALLEVVNGQWLIELQTETRMLPGSVVRRKVDEMAARIEQEQGRKPGKRERREMKDEAMLSLLPQAFTKLSGTRLWIDPVARLLSLSATSQNRADAITTFLIDSLPGLKLTLIQTAESPAACMSAWLHTREAPAGFTVDQECELKSTDASKASVKYAKHPLEIDEVREHIDAGKLPTRLAMTWEGQISFLLTDSLQLKKISFLEGETDAPAGAAKDEDHFDADMALTTGMLGRMIPELLEALGGEAREAAPVAQPA